MSTILVVEDNKESRYLMEQMFISRGHQVFSAENGLKGLELARQNPPDMIISDIMMPVMNGFKLCSKIKKDPFLCHIPFIFYTATFVEETDKKLAMSLGASHFVIKPAIEDQFVGIIDNVLREHREGILDVPERPLEDEDVLLEMYDNALVRKLTETVERLQFEQKALTQSERRLKEAQELAHIGHWELDLENDSLEWSDELYRILGVKPRAFDPSYKTVLALDLIHPDDRDAVTKAHKDSLVKKTPCDIEYRLLFEDGAVKYVNERFQTLFDDHGIPICAMGTVQDITERREGEEERQKLQAQLNQAQKLESIGMLAGGVAHDFNNKLSVILAYTELAMERLNSEDPIYRELQEVHKAGKRSVEIVRQLLAFARKQTIAPRVLDMNETVEGMLNMLRRLIGEGLELLWQPGSELWTVRMDQSQIDQILANLCVNARDAISGVGKIRIATANVVMADAQYSGDGDCVPGNYVMLSISDDGIGMDESTLENAFEPFFTTKTVGKGTGLGLSTVYGIVKQNHGFIKVDSEPGKGTHFRIYLPTHHEKAERAGKKEKNRIPRGQGETVLVVEDEESLLQLMEVIVERLGYRVLAAGSPEEAVKMAGKYPDDICLLLTDVVLPEMSGRELAAEMARIRPKIRTLFMSGYTADVIADHGMQSAGIQFIQKPFTADSLAGKIAEVLST